MRPETISLPGETSSVPPARRFVELTLAQWDLDDLAWPATLLVSELTTNACLHARTGMTVTLTRTEPGGVRLEVRDGSPSLPRVRQHAQQATTGRGLRLVEELSERWGVDELEGGKAVWAELAPPDEGPGRGSEEAEDAGDLDVDDLLAMFPDEMDADVPRALAA